MFRFGTLVAIALALATIPATARAVAPAPCNNAPQITDANGDGHHPGTDVLAAWWSEASGHLQAVIQTRAGLFVAEHDDAQINGSSYALVFGAGGKTWYVRANGPQADRAQDPVVYEFGSYAAGGFTPVGATTGFVDRAITAGTVTIDVPAAVGAVAGTKLTNPFAVTYDGINAGEPTWVDHAPGGEEVTDSARGADYVVGSCGGGSGGGGATATPTPGATPGPGTIGTGAITSVQLQAPARVTGRRTVTITGRVLPARAGVRVTLTRRGLKTAHSRATSAADGTFAFRVAVRETTRLRAAADGIGSSELTVTARTAVKIKVRNRADGSAVVTGTVDPKLPGRVLWLRSNAIKASARTTTRNGRFTLRLKHPTRGRYQAVVIPFDGRAERATSNTGVIR